MLGSPPRVRGKAYADRQGQRRFGITPARAGKSFCSSLSPAFTMDHPRACGEKSVHFPLFSNIVGSPPRVRGKAKPPETRTSDERITPARAGKSMSSVMLSSAVRDHPRACGEKSAPRPRCASMPGSPPRVRGKVPRAAGPVSSIRITPARAGKRPFEVVKLLSV